jgi:hypothetical protein
MWPKRDQGADLNILKNKCCKPLKSGVYPPYKSVSILQLQHVSGWGPVENNFFRAAKINALLDSTL